MDNTGEGSLSQSAYDADIEHKADAPSYPSGATRPQTRVSAAVGQTKRTRLPSAAPEADVAPPEPKVARHSTHDWTARTEAMRRATEVHVDVPPALLAPEQKKHFDFMASHRAVALNMIGEDQAGTADLIMFIARHVRQDDWKEILDSKVMEFIHSQRPSKGRAPNRELYAKFLQLALYLNEDDPEKTEVLTGLQTQLSRGGARDKPELSDAHSFLVGDRSVLEIAYNWAHSRELGVLLSIIMGKAPTYLCDAFVKHGFGAQVGVSSSEAARQWRVQYVIANAPNNPESWMSHMRSQALADFETSVPDDAVYKCEGIFETQYDPVAYLTGEKVCDRQYPIHLLLNTALINLCTTKLRYYIAELAPIRAMFSGSDVSQNGHLSRVADYTLSIVMASYVAVSQFSVAAALYFVIKRFDTMYAHNSIVPHNVFSSMIALTSMLHNNMLAGLRRTLREMGYKALQIEMTAQHLPPRINPMLPRVVRRLLELPNGPETLSAVMLVCALRKLPVFLQIVFCLHNLVADAGGLSRGQLGIVAEMYGAIALGNCKGVFAKSKVTGLVDTVVLINFKYDTFQLSQRWVAFLTSELTFDPSLSRCLSLAIEHSPSMVRQMLTALDVEPGRLSELGDGELLDVLLNVLVAKDLPLVKPPDAYLDDLDILQLLYAMAREAVTVRQHPVCAILDPQLESTNLLRVARAKPLMAVDLETFNRIAVWGLETPDTLHKLLAEHVMLPDVASNKLTQTVLAYIKGLCTPDNVLQMIGYSNALLLSQQDRSLPPTMRVRHMDYLPLTKRALQVLGDSARDALYTGGSELCWEALAMLGCDPVGVRAAVHLQSMDPKWVAHVLCEVLASHTRVVEMNSNLSVKLPPQHVYFSVTSGVPTVLRHEYQAFTFPVLAMLAAYSRLRDYGWSAPEQHLTSCDPAQYGTWQQFLAASYNATQPDPGEKLAWFVSNVAGNHTFVDAMAEFCASKNMLDPSDVDALRNTVVVSPAVVLALFSCRPFDRGTYSPHTFRLLLEELVAGVRVYAQLCIEDARSTTYWLANLVLQLDLDLATNTYFEPEPIKPYMVGDSLIVHGHLPDLCSIIARDLTPNQYQRAFAVIDDLLAKDPDTTRRGIAAMRVYDAGFQRPLRRQYGITGGGPWRFNLGTVRAETGEMRGLMERFAEQFKAVRRPEEGWMCLYRGSSVEDMEHEVSGRWQVVTKPVSTSTNAAIANMYFMKKIQSNEKVGLMKLIVDPDVPMLYMMALDMNEHEVVIHPFPDDSPTQVVMYRVDTTTAAGLLQENTLRHSEPSGQPFFSAVYLVTLSSRVLKRDAVLEIHHARTPSAELMLPRTMDPKSWGVYSDTSVRQKLSAAEWHFAKLLLQVKRLTNEPPQPAHADTYVFDKGPESYIFSTVNTAIGIHNQRLGYVPKNTDLPGVTGIRMPDGVCFWDPELQGQLTTLGNKHGLRVHGFGLYTFDASALLNRKLIPVTTDQNYGYVSILAKTEIGGVIPTVWVHFQPRVIGAHGGKPMPSVRFLPTEASAITDLSAKEAENMKNPGPPLRENQFMTVHVSREHPSVFIMQSRSSVPSSSEYVIQTANILSTLNLHRSPYVPVFRGLFRVRATDPGSPDVYMMFLSNTKGMPLGMFLNKTANTPNLQKAVVFQLLFALHKLEESGVVFREFNENTVVVQETPFKGPGREQMFYVPGGTHIVDCFARPVFTECGLFQVNRGTARFLNHPYQLYTPEQFSDWQAGKADRTEQKYNAVRQVQQLIAPGSVLSTVTWMSAVRDFCEAHPDSGPAEILASGLIVPRYTVPAPTAAPHG